MDRRKALVVSLLGALLVMALVAAEITLLRMASSKPEVGAFGSDLAATTTTRPDVVTTSPEPIIEYQDVYETVAGSSSPARQDVQAPTAAPTQVSGAGSPGGAPTTRSSPAPLPAPGNVTPTVVPTAPTTTVVGTTTTTRPPGVPADWPAGKPIPPMPPGCQKPQLEDNGVWNCDH